MRDRRAGFQTTSLAGFLILALATALFPNASAAAKFKVIHSFCSPNANCVDGYGGSGKLLVDSAGDVFGTTAAGGLYSVGTIFEMTPSGSGWSYKTIYNFCAQTGCPDGAEPNSLILDQSGNLYGGTAAGGTGSGVIFKLTPEGTYTILYTLCPGGGQCNDGFAAFRLTYAGASEGLAYDGTSPLYGMSEGGAGGVGNIFSLESGGSGAWSYSVIHAFCSATKCADGEFPGALTLDASGNLLGVAIFGGKHRQGLVFKLTQAEPGQWDETSLYDFCTARRCPDGATPVSLSIASDGALYGTAARFGPNCLTTKHLKDCGVLFRLNPDGTGYDVLYGFCAQENCSDGGAPIAMEEVRPGDFFGATSSGGVSDVGTLFELHNGIFRSRYQFCEDKNGTKGCPHGSLPQTGLTAGPSGTLFGTTAEGGAFGYGEVFELFP